MKYEVFFVLALMVLLTSASNHVLAQKVSPEDIISRHLDSIASTEVRSAFKSFIAVGDVRVTNITRKTPPATGRVVVASSGNRSFFGLNLNSTDNPTEKIVFDGKQSKVEFTIPGTRSILGNLLQSNSMMIEDGLLLGALSTNWVFERFDARRPKLTYGGKKKINGIEAYSIKYSPRGGSDFDIEMYFDQANSRHIRTEYRRTASASIGRTIDESARQNETRIKVTEDFSGFQTVQGITIPSKYRMVYSITGQNGTNEIAWEFDLLEFGVNAVLDESTFIVDRK